MDGSRIRSIEWGTLVGQRPRTAGCNSRIAIHGQEVQVQLARVTTDDGSSGFGPCRAFSEAEAFPFLGMCLGDLIDRKRGAADRTGKLEFPLWDLLGQREGRPVYRLLAEVAGKTAPESLRVRCYDTSLYIDDLHLATDGAGAALIAAEASYGYEHGHRSFKIKVGRGARHMPLVEGNRRDVAVIRAVREAVGAEATILIDANNGYNLNIAKQILSETADCNVFWLEEAFHEDGALYEDLHAWIEREGLGVNIADGEGLASPMLLDYARDGFVDIIQYDIFSHGMTNWLETGALLDGWNVRTAPHHYGRHVGNYVSGHLAAAVDGFLFVEWDEVTTPGLDGSAYRVEEGQMLVPDAPGFGLKLDEELFQQAVTANGFVVEAS
ncbi:MAG: hypothetical protein OXF62_10235 [Caldilineaceae bacterium]|nr:hypothetical protein [Caldilineaceae bacterium]MCY4116349.1 hypothetical protein [Caldilineaceae bacterium]